MVIDTSAVILHTMCMPQPPDTLVPNDLREAMKPEAIGYRLRLLREAHNKKPSEMADILDVERTYWSRFENGKRRVSDDVAALLVLHFGVTLDFLILGKWDKLPMDLALKLRAAEAPK